MTANSQISTTEPKKKNKSKLSQQLEQEQNHRNGDYMEGQQWGGGEGRVGETVQGAQNRQGYIKETEKPKNLYV